MRAVLAVILIGLLGPISAHALAHKGDPIGDINKILEPEKIDFLNSTGRCEMAKLILGYCPSLYVTNYKGQLLDAIAAKKDALEKYYTKISAEADEVLPLIRSRDAKVISASMLENYLWSLEITHNLLVEVASNPMSEGLAEKVRLWVSTSPRDTIQITIPGLVRCNSGRDPINSKKQLSSPAVIDYREAPSVPWDKKVVLSLAGTVEVSYKGYSNDHYDTDLRCRRVEDGTGEDIHRYYEHGHFTL